MYFIGEQFLLLKIPYHHFIIQGHGIGQLIHGQDGMKPGQCPVRIGALCFQVRSHIVYQIQYRLFAVTHPGNHVVGLYNGIAQQYRMNFCGIPDHGYGQQQVGAGIFQERPVTCHI